MGLLRKRLSLFERRLFCTNPDESQAVPSCHVRYAPFFYEFLQSNEGAALRDIRTLNDACVAFGMSYRPIECVDGRPSNQKIFEQTTGRVVRGGLIVPDEDDDNESEWIEEPEVWLPSVPALRRAIYSVVTEGSLPIDIGQRLIFEIYGRLTEEYYAKISDVHTQFKEEEEVRQEGVFC